MFIAGRWKAPWSLSSLSTDTWWRPCVFFLLTDNLPIEVWFPLLVVFGCAAPFISGIMFYLSVCLFSVPVCLAAFKCSHTPTCPPNKTHIHTHMLSDGNVRGILNLWWALRIMGAVFGLFAEGQKVERVYFIQRNMPRWIYHVWEVCCHWHISICVFEAAVVDVWVIWPGYIYGKLGNKKCD